MTFGVWELVVILFILLLIFGAGRLSEVGGAVGKSIREFRKATTESQAAPPPAAQATDAAAGPAVENKCPSCATVNRGSQAFCGQCGTRLTVAA
jgi:sec-independent protein translocase protein TatA